MLRNLSPRGRERMTRHHLTPQSRFLRDDKRKDLPENLMQFWNDRHEIWHMLFRNRTLEEIIVFFGLMHRLFGDRPPAEIIATLQRLARAKKRPESGYWLPTPYLD